MSKDKEHNCWDFMKCGREPGGKHSLELGVCPAAADATFDGFNQGNNAGRICWLIAGTFCGGRIQGSFAEKQGSCKNCTFYKQIHADEGATDLTMRSKNIFARTHIGLVRKSNEDRYLIKDLKDDTVLLAVADGLGGEVAGDYAAEILRGKLASIDHISRNKEQAEIDQLVREIDRTIDNDGRKDTRLEGMGSTLICVLLRDEIAHWLHVGESRLYILRNRKLTQVTEDQTLARFLLEEGEITEEQVPAHYSRHVMDQYVGCGYAEPEAGSLEIRDKDLLVLAADGLHKQITGDTLHSLLNAEGSLEAKAKSLVKAALDAGGKDNITVLLAEM
jgi:protein phosphatase